MIKHVVIFKMKAGAEGRTASENLQELKARLEALPGKIPEIRTFEVGANINPSAMAFDLVLYSEFEDEMALITYQKHPDHQEIVGFIHQVCADRKVVDWER